MGQSGRTTGTSACRFSRSCCRACRSNVGYFRRSFGNFFVTDNRAFAPSDFDKFSITAPARPAAAGRRRPGDLRACTTSRPDKFGQQDNFFTSADNYGKRTETWNGVEVEFQRADPRRSHAPGRHQHRPDNDGQLRDPGAVCRRRQR